MMETLQTGISTLFQSIEETSEPEQVGINGNIPDWLRGSYFQLGPGKLDLEHSTLNDWLDGYALISKFEIGDGPLVSFESKLGQTEALQKAVLHGKPFFTEYGTAGQVDENKSFFSKLVSTFSREDMSDNCSASLNQFGGHLCASAPTCYFYSINPKTLATGERHDAKKLCGQNGYGVHPLVDDNGDMWNMGFTILPTLKYNIVKIPGVNKGNGDPIEKVFSKAKTVASVSSRWNGAFALNHSFGMTESHIIFIEQPYVIRVSKVLSAKIKGYSVKEWLEWRPEDKNRFYLIDKKSGKVLNLEAYSSEAFFFLHVVNCYQEGNQIIIDILTSKNPSATDGTSLSKLRNNILDPVENSQVQRFTIPLIFTEGTGLRDVPENKNLIEALPMSSKASVVKRGNTLILTPDDISSLGPDCFSINQGFMARKYSYVFAAGTFLSDDKNKDNPFAHSVCKVNLDRKEVKRWFSSGSHYPGEPLFIPRVKGSVDSNLREDQQEDDGVVLCPVLTVDPKEDNFLLFIDAKSWKELGRASFKGKIGGMLHGIFLPK